MDLIKKYKRSILFLIIFICIIAMIFTAGRDQPGIIGNVCGTIVAGTENVLHSIGSWFGDGFDVLFNSDKLKKENTQLKAEITEKDLLLDRMSEIEKENKELRELLDMDNRYPEYTKKEADIIAKDPGNWYETFTINKGSADGIKQDMVVIASGGLVGRVTECGFNYSKVMSVINSTDAVSAKSLRSNDVGFIRGDYSQKGKCRMEYIDNDAEIIEGDEIVTSHLSDIYPQGIRIGYVSEIGTGTNNLTRLAIVEPSVDFKHLQKVLVITEDFKKEYVQDLEKSDSSGTKNSDK